MPCLFNCEKVVGGFTYLIVFVLVPLSRQGWVVGQNHVAAAQLQLRVHLKVLSRLVPFQVFAFV